MALPTRATSPTIRVGTCGWQYRDWVGPMYPRSLRPTEYLACYSEQFATVEVNSTFYRLPSATAVSAWRAETPTDFVFSCKASRFITHMKKLREPDKSTPPFFDRIGDLRPKLGPILFQLPPRWRVDLQRLREFVDALPLGYRFVFEFRDASWMQTDVLELLTERNAGFCIFDLAGTVSPFEVTSDVVYVRLHGPREAYQGSYNDRAIATWAERLAGWRDTGRDVFCYFDNDQSGCAVNDARRLIAALD